jgi:hypothetical protein
VCVGWAGQGRAQGTEDQETHGAHRHTGGQIKGEEKEEDEEDKDKKKQE